MTSPGCDKAVILAAGGGARVKALAGDGPKCLIELGGRPIIDWVLEAVGRAGVRQAVVITGFRGNMLRRSVGSRRCGLSIEYVHNRNWRLANGVSLYAAREAVGPDERFLTLMSDHVLPASIIRNVARARTSSCLLAVDMNPDGVYDIGDATKVRLADGLPAAIGKRLRRYDAVDCGLFRFDPRVFKALEAAFDSGKMSLTDGVRVLIRNGDLEVLAIEDGTFWIDIDTPGAHRQAVRRLAVRAPDAGAGS
jgi:choline kinase